MEALGIILALAAMLIIALIVFAAMFLVFKKIKGFFDKLEEKDDQSIRDAITAEQRQLAETATPKVGEESEFDDNVLIKGSPFINIYPLRDPRVRKINRLVEADLGNGVCEAFLRTGIDTKRRSVTFHQIYYRTRSRDISWFDHRTVLGAKARDNLKSEAYYEAETITPPGRANEEYWGGRIGSLYLLDHRIDIPDDTLRGYSSNVKFRVATTERSWVIELPLVHVRAQIECVDQYLREL